MFDFAPGPDVAAPCASPRARRGSTARRAGIAAEEAAERLYRERGARILARNWRAGRDFGGGELDLIARDGDVLVFVEVKTRRTIEEAAHAISPAQWRRLEAAALGYMIAAETGETECRFDAVLIGRDGRLERVENARGA